jgi:hypothetical protein
MKIEKITMTLKRVQYQTIEVTKSNGYEMPDNASDFISMVEDLKNEPLNHTKELEWDQGEVEIIGFDIKE